MRVKTTAKTLKLLSSQALRAYLVPFEYHKVLIENA